MCEVVIVIPAAGASSRMRGRDKLLEEVEGMPLLARQAAMAARTGCAVLVTLPEGGGARHAVLGDDPAVAVTCLEDAPEGIAASIRAGARWAAGRRADGLMVVLADLPELESADLERMVEGFGQAPDRVLRATDITGRAGHPVIFPARLFPALGRTEGDIGAKTLLRSEDIRTLPLPDRRATTDLDTPEAWAAWRKAKAKGP